MEQPTSMRRFTPAGRVKADALVADLTAQGIQAKIAPTWMDYGAGMAWETILVYNHKIKMWYQSLTPSDFNTINAGGEPPGYRDEIIKKNAQVKPKEGVTL